MEEILASIRKIISEDSNDSPPQPAAAPQPVALAAAQEVDVLELTQEVQEAPVQHVQPAPAPVRMAAQPARPADDVVFQSIEEAPVTVVAQTPSLASEGHVSDRTRSALDDALAGLDTAPVVEAQTPPPAAPQITTPLPNGSVEAVFDRAVRTAFDPVMRAWLQEHPDVMAERLKPFIREWMDENLPAIVKSVVEQEIAGSRARNKR